MWHELNTVKDLTLKQLGNDVGKYLDHMKILTLEIDKKDSLAYRENVHIKDILTQLQTAPVNLYANVYEAL